LDSEDIFSGYFYGKTPLIYVQDGKKRQDVSGSAWDGGRLLLAYDGGHNSVNVGVKLYPQSTDNISLDNIWNDGLLLTRSVMQRDIEGATFLNERYFTTSSMSLVDEESPGYRLLVEFTLDEEKRQIVWERSVDLRNSLVRALKDVCKDPYWFGRITNVFGKRGGINVEGLSFDPLNPDGLIIGLRSPLCSKSFGLPELGEGLSLRNGRAIMFRIDQPFDAEPNYEPVRLDLNGHGIRGMEYIPDLKGFIVIGGPVEKANDYSLWFYSDKGELSSLSIPGFEKLCRPESVAEFSIKGDKAIVILSEEAGEACDDTPFTYIAATIKLQ
jgi:hypothetical protein